MVCAPRPHVRIINAVLCRDTKDQVTPHMIKTSNCPSDEISCWLPLPLWVCRYQYSQTHPAISTDSDATATAGRKSLSDLHYAKRRGGRLRALHAAQLLAMAAGSSGCEDAHVDPSG